MKSGQLFNYFDLTDNLLNCFFQKSVYTLTADANALIKKNRQIISPAGRPNYGIIFNWVTKV